VSGGRHHDRMRAPDTPCTATTTNHITTIPIHHMTTIGTGIWCRYKMDKSMFSVAVLSALVCIVEDPTMGIIVGALLGMIVMLLQMRTAHATLRLYSGSLCRLNYLFEGVDTARTTTACKKKYTVSEGNGGHTASGGATRGAVDVFSASVFCRC